METFYSPTLYEPITLIDDFDIVFTITHDPGSYIPSHWHDGLEIIFLLEGSLKVFFGEREITLAKNDCIVINSKTIHSTKSLHANSAVLMQLPYAFLAKYIPEISSLFFDVSVHPTDSIIQTKVFQLKETLQQMRIAFEVAPSGMALRFHSLLFDFLYQLYHNFKTEIPASSINLHSKSLARLEPIIKYTDIHHSEHISIADIASIANLQPEYFCRFFKKNMGTTYLEFLNEIRISHIYHDLLTTDYPIYQILEKHGFTNYKLFRKMFANHFGSTPNAIRKSILN